MQRLKKFAFLSATFAAVLSTPWQYAFLKKKFSDENDIIDYESFSDNFVHDLSKVKIFSINRNRDLANEIVFHLNTRLSKLRIFRTTIANDSYIEILENVRSKHVYFICCFSPEKTMNDTLVELFLAISAAKRASASKVYVIMPYYAYTRQNDINNKHRKSYFAADIAALLQASGADKIITSNMQSPSSLGFFNIPIIEVDGYRLCSNYFKDHEFKDLLLVCSNDKLFQSALHVKDHLEDLGHNGIDVGLLASTADEALQYVGSSVENRDIIIIDSIVDTGKTIIKAASYLNKLGARHIYGFGVHGVLSEEASSNIEKSHIRELVVTNTIPIELENVTTKINQVSIAKMLAEAIAQSSFNKPLDQLKKEGII